jgi:arylsulfatase A
MIGKRVCALLVTVLAATPAAAQGRPPNFVLILMDDLGWKDLGATGSLYYQTPNIDKIARAGMIFNQAYSASPLCSPSRGALWSGKAPARTALTNVGGLVDPYGGLHEITKPMEWPNGNTQYLEAFARHVLPLEEVTIAEALAEAGYVTGYYGKWHCGQHENFQPDKQGFRHADTLSRVVERDGSPTVEKSEGDVKQVGALTAAAVRFIEEQQEHPFFLTVAHYAVHRPLEARPELVEKYRALPKTDQGNPVFAALLESVDESVGTIDATLGRLGLQDNTVLIFASDNGGLTLGPDTSNYPLLGGKSFPYEAGMRTPLFVRWPSRIAAGSHSDTRVIHMDLYPTILEMAGLPLRPRQHLDGLSLMPLLTASGALTDRDLYFHFPHPTHATGPFASVISRDWKLIRWYNDTSGAYSLFNLAEDPGELVDLADRLPDRVKEMSDQLARWQRETNAQMPLPNPHFDPSRPPVRDKAFTRNLAMKEREEFERRLKEYEASVSKSVPR